MRKEIQGHTKFTFAFQVGIQQTHAANKKRMNLESKQGKQHTTMKNKDSKNHQQKQSKTVKHYTVEKNDVQKDVRIHLDMHYFKSTV